MSSSRIFRNGLLVASLNNILFSPATASWTALDLVTETPEQGQKLQHYQGHCRDDEDCEVGLQCVLRSNDDFEELLEQYQCTGTLEYEVNYCVDIWWSHPQIKEETSSVANSPTGDDVSNQEHEDPVNSTLKEEDGADDIIVETPPFVLGIRFNTPTRRQLGSLADNISPSSLESIVAYLVGEEMSTMYPNAFQDVGIMAELIKETEEKDITTLAYRCSSHFIFSSKEEHLPSPVDLYSIAIGALNRDLFSGGFRTSSDVVLSAASDGFILTADEYFQHSKPYAKENAQASLVPPAYTAESESSPSIVLLAASAGFVLFVAMLLYMQKMKRKGAATDSSAGDCDSSKDNASSLPTEELNKSLEDLEDSFVSCDKECGEGSTGDLSDLDRQSNFEENQEGGITTNSHIIHPSPVPNASLGEIYEQRSDIGDYSIDSVAYFESHAGDSVAMESVVDSIGQSDWSMIEGGGQINFGDSIADNSSLRKTRNHGGKTGPMLVRRNVELFGTIRALDEVEIHVEGGNENKEGSIADSSLGDNGSLLENVKARNVLQVDEIDTQVEGEDFHDVWKS